MPDPAEELAQRFAGYDEVSDRSSSATKRWARDRTAFDPTQPEAYDRDHVYMRATNKHDHSAKLVIHLPKDQLAAFQKLVALEESPYDSVADLYRDAGVHQFVYMSERVKDPEFAMLKRTMIGKALLDEFEHNYEIQKAYIEQISVMTTKLANDQAWHELADYIITCREWVDDLVEPWATRLEEVVTTAEARLPDDDDLIG